MDHYLQQLTRWADSLAAGRSTALLDDLAGYCSADDVARYLENAMGERRRLLIEELSFVALAFDDFHHRVDQYLRETPRRTYDVAERDQERFLVWLRRGALNAQQKDFVSCQAAEYACFAKAQKNRVAHLKFQRLWSEREQVTETRNERNQTILVNPVHVWSRLEVAASDEGGSHAGDVIFVAVASEIRSLWIETSQQTATRDLTTNTEMSLGEWRKRHPELNHEEFTALSEQLTAGGLIVVC